MVPGTPEGASERAKLDALSPRTSQFSHCNANPLVPHSRDATAGISILESVTRTLIMLSRVVAESLQIRANCHTGLRDFALEACYDEKRELIKLVRSRLAALIVS